MSNASTTKKLFSRETSLTASIQAPIEKVWSVLTNAPEYEQWNSTIKSFNGNIALGGQIELVSTLAPERTFKLKVKEFDAPNRLVWSDTMGSRLFELEEKKGYTLFSMSEKIGGPLFPLFSRMIPEFDDAFDQFTADLIKKCTDS